MPNISGIILRMKIIFCVHVLELYFLNSSRCPAPCLVQLWLKIWKKTATPFQSQMEIETVTEEETASTLWGNWRKISHFFNDIFKNWENILTTVFFLEYVDLYVDYILNKSIYRQFAAFYHGFHSVCASNALIVSVWIITLLYT